MRLAEAMKKNIELTFFIIFYNAWMMLIYYGMGEDVLLFFLAAELVGLAIGFLVVIVVYIIHPIKLFSELGKGLFWGPYLILTPALSVKLFNVYIPYDNRLTLAAVVFITSFLILFTIEPRVREAFLRPILGYYN